MKTPEKPLTLENIESLLSEETIWHWLIPNFQKVNKSFSIRKEDKPSCRISPKNNKLFLKDFGDSDKSYTWLTYMLEKQGMSFFTALETIRDTFSLELGNYNSKNNNSSNNLKQPLIYPKEKYKECHTIIRYLSRPWGWDIDSEYWLKKYEITECELTSLFYVIPLSHYWIINEEEHCFKVTKDNPCYCYPIGNRRKLYKPYDKKGFKWFANTTIDDVFGLHLLPKELDGKTIFIESSYKDTMVMYKAGFHSLPVTNGENSFIPEKLFYKLKNKGAKFIVHFDNDPPGIKAAKILNEKYNIPYIVQPELYNKEGKLIKDPSDYVEEFKYNELKLMINSLL